MQRLRIQMMITFTTPSKSTHNQQRIQQVRKYVLIYSKQITQFILLTFKRCLRYLPRQVGISTTIICSVFLRMGTNCIMRYSECYLEILEVMFKLRLELVLGFQLLNIWEALSPIEYLISQSHRSIQIKVWHLELLMTFLNSKMGQQHLKSIFSSLCSIITLLEKEGLEFSIILNQLLHLFHNIQHQQIKKVSLSLMQRNMLLISY